MVVVDTSVAAIAMLVAAALVVATAEVVVVTVMVVDHKVLAVADEVLIEVGVRLQRHSHGFHRRTVVPQDQ
jgi:hypothetical protein